VAPACMHPLKWFLCRKHEMAMCQAPGLLHWAAQHQRSVLLHLLAGPCPWHLPPLHWTSLQARVVLDTKWWLPSRCVPKSNFPAMVHLQHTTQNANATTSIILE
jgi:hypothetical protein